MMNSLDFLLQLIQQTRNLSKSLQFRYLLPIRKNCLQQEFDKLLQDHTASLSEEQIAINLSSPQQYINLIEKDLIVVSFRSQKRSLDNPTSMTSEDYRYIIERFIQNRKVKHSIQEKEFALLGLFNFGLLRYSFEGVMSSYLLRHDPKNQNILKKADFCNLSMDLNVIVLPKESPPQALYQFVMMQYIYALKGLRFSDFYPFPDLQQGLFYDRMADQDIEDYLFVIQIPSHPSALFSEINSKYKILNIRWNKIIKFRYPIEESKILYIKDMMPQISEIGSEQCCLFRAADELSVVYNLELNGIQTIRN